MRRVNTAPDEITYSARIKGTPGATYYLYAILKDGEEYSNIVSYVINLPY
jgi:hypothetical protein